jgi:peroxiredoxin
MEAVLLFARLLLAAVLGVAAVGKLADLSGSRTALAEFGLPRRSSALLGTLLPVLELVIAVSLLPGSSAWAAALGALVLLVLFVVVIGVNLVRGREPDCHCFGQLHSRPIGLSTLLRNAALAAVAAFVVVEGASVTGPSAVLWVSQLNAAGRFEAGLGAGLVVGLGLSTWMWLGLLREHGRLLLRLDALEARVGFEGTETAAASSHTSLPVGAIAPEFSLPDLNGTQVTLSELRSRDTNVVLTFLEPACGPCVALMPELARWQRRHSGRQMLVVISGGSVEENRARSQQYGLANVLLQREHEVAEAYLVPGTPSALLVRSDGSVGSALAMGFEPIAELLESVVGDVDALERNAGHAALPVTLIEAGGSSSTR